MATTPPTRRPGLLRSAASSVRRWLQARPRAGSGPVARPSDAGTAYPGDFTGRLTPVYAPKPDGEPDPGEVVWTWVPYEEDHAQGKDRPVLLVGHDGPWLLALPLTSRDHDRDAAPDARDGRRWVDVGAGGWDRHGRPSEARVDRVVRVRPDAVRREGAVLAPERFAAVAAALARAPR
ncbi:MAG TPA: type II toxin-antitoxin system PemK/MazF family toxin [Ornithinibacter sp.]|nr:type II toxin-antitoxin system PemK/MazF family toxin [Ornithinibacter sp.]